jgi:outer membrane protein insertion porin family
MNCARFFSPACVWMSFCRPAFFLILVLASFGARAAKSQQSKGGASHLDSVEISGSKKFSSQQIAAAIGLRAGNIITREDLQGAADKLAALGLFSNVQYHFTTVQSGVRAIYEVSDAPAVAVTFDNFPWFTDDELTAALKRAVLLFDGSAPQGGAILNTMAATLENLVQARGVLGTVSHALINFPLGGQRMQFRVEGTEITVKGVEFSDALATNDHAVQQSAAALIGQPYSRSAVKLFEFEQVRPVYLTHAFLHVQFGQPGARIPSEGAQPGSTAVVVVVSITPGPAFQWGSIAWAGNSVVSSGELDAIVTLKPGDIADGVKIAALWDGVQSLYGQRGYLDVKLDPQTQFDDQAGRVMYNVTITEGPQYRMGNLVLSGLSVDGEKRIHAAWSIPANAVFNVKTYEAFLDDGIKKAFAGTPVHYEKIGRFLQENPGTNKVDVLLDFQ